MKRQAKKTLSLPANPTGMGSKICSLARKTIAASLAGAALLFAVPFAAAQTPTDTGWTQYGSKIFAAVQSAGGTLSAVSFDNEDGGTGGSFDSGTAVTLAGVATNSATGVFALLSIDVNGTMDDDWGTTSLYGFLSLNDSAFTGSINDGVAGADVSVTGSGELIGVHFRKATDGAGKQDIGAGAVINFGDIYVETASDKSTAPGDYAAAYGFSAGKVDSTASVSLGKVSAFAELGGDAWAVEFRGDVEGAVTIDGLEAKAIDRAVGLMVTQGNAGTTTNKVTITDDVTATTTTTDSTAPGIGDPAGKYAVGILVDNGDAFFELGDSTITATVNGADAFGIAVIGSADITGNPTIAALATGDGNATGVRIDGSLSNLSADSVSATAEGAGSARAVRIVGNILADAEIDVNTIIVDAATGVANGFDARGAVAVDSKINIGSIVSTSEVAAQGASFRGVVESDAIAIDNIYAEATGAGGGAWAFTLGSGVTDGHITEDAVLTLGTVEAQSFDGEAVAMTMYGKVEGKVTVDTITAESAGLAQGVLGRDVLGTAANPFTVLNSVSVTSGAGNAFGIYVAKNDDSSGAGDGYLELSGTISAVSDSTNAADRAVGVGAANDLNILVGTGGVNIEGTRDGITDGLSGGIIAGNDLNIYLAGNTLTSNSTQASGDITINDSGTANLGSVSLAGDFTNADTATVNVTGDLNANAVTNNGRLNVTGDLDVLTALTNSGILKVDGILTNGSLDNTGGLLINNGTWTYGPSANMLDPLEGEINEDVFNSFGDTIDVFVNGLSGAFNVLGDTTITVAFADYGKTFVDAGTTLTFAFNDTVALINELGGTGDVIASGSVEIVNTDVSGFFGNITAAENVSVWDGLYAGTIGGEDVSIRDGDIRGAVAANNDVTVFGGSFSSTVSAVNDVNIAGGVFGDTVYAGNDVNIADGYFMSTVTADQNVNIEGGLFDDSVTAGNNVTIADGYFMSTVAAGNNMVIEDGVFDGAVSAVEDLIVTGGMFNDVVGANNMSIQGGAFNDTVGAGNDITVYDGAFYVGANVNAGNDVNVANGVFHDAVNAGNNVNIANGDFRSTVAAGNDMGISNGSFGDAVSATRDLVVAGGTFFGTVGAGNNASISGGKFYSTVGAGNDVTVYDGAFYAGANVNAARDVNIANGIFHDAVNAGRDVNIANGDFRSTVAASNDVNIANGLFYSAVSAAHDMNFGAGNATFLNNVFVGNDATLHGGSAVHLSPTSTMNVGGNWTSIGANDLVFATDTADIGHVYIEGDVVGNTNVRISGLNTSADVRAFMDNNGTAVALITADGDMSNGDFTMQSQKAGRYQMNLAFDGTDTWNLGVESSRLVLPDLASLVTMSTVGFDLPMGLERHRERSGRTWNSQAGTVLGQQARGRYAGGPWVRFKGGEIDTDASAFSDHSYQSLQAGWDQTFDAVHGGAWNAGLFFDAGWLDGKGTYDAFGDREVLGRMKSSTEGEGGGFYVAREFRNRIYLDVAGRFNSYRTKMDNVMFAAEDSAFGYHARWNHQMFNLGMEVGRNFTSRNGTFVFNPYNRVMYNTAAGEKFGIAFGDETTAAVAVNGFDAWTNRLGGRLTINQFSTLKFGPCDPCGACNDDMCGDGWCGDNRRIKRMYFVGADWYKGLSGKYGASAVDSLGLPVDISMGRTRNNLSYGVASAGVTFLPTDRIAISLAGEGLFGDVKGYGMVFATKVSF